MRRESAGKLRQAREATDSTSAVDFGADPGAADAIAGGACQPRGGVQIVKILGVARAKQGTRKRKIKEKGRDQKGSRLTQVLQVLSTQSGGRGGGQGHTCCCIQARAVDRPFRESTTDWSWSALGRVFFK